MIHTLKSVILEVANQLSHHALWLSTAESCTGGGLSYWLTSVPGSSAWFERGFVTYSNAAKGDMLDVNLHTIDTYGAVSQETAQEMAEGALKHSTADISLAITGIAGPTGGSLEKPVGTVWIACATRHRTTEARVFLFPGDRQAIRLGAMTEACHLLLTQLP